MTVCHLLGNGAYHLLTFDDSALRAHLGHGDLYPVPEGGCPVPEGSAPGVSASGSRGATGTDSTEGARTGTTLGGADVESAGSVRELSAGLAAEQAAPVSRSAAVLGVEAERSAGRAPAQIGARSAADSSAAAVSPAAGVLPQTGAGQVALTLGAGLGLLVSGAALLRRRRLQSGH